MASITLTRADAQRLVDFCATHKATHYFIAKDQGAYIGYSVGAKPEQQCLWYFKGCDPTKDSDFWENSRAKFGGDDFGENLEVAGIVTMLGNADVQRIKWTITKTSMKVEAFA